MTFRKPILLRDEDQPVAVGWNITESVRSRFRIRNRWTLDEIRPDLAPIVRSGRAEIR